eukprot:SAG11_NODE_4890_length_1732_cov_2.017146_2_plen_121_part_00
MPSLRNTVQIKARKSEQLELEAGVGDVVRWQFWIDKYDCRISINFHETYGDLEMDNAPPSTTIMQHHVVGDPVNASAGGKCFGAYMAMATGLVRFHIDNTVRPRTKVCLFVPRVSAASCG